MDDVDNLKGESDMGESLWMALQPIVHLTSGHVVGHETLVRGPAGSSWESPAAIFAYADRTRQTAVLEAMCRRLAFQTAKQVLPRDQRVFINVNLATPDIPLDPGHAGMDPSRVAVEVSEQNQVVGYSQLLAAIHAWRAAGYQIVLDDYGAGYSSLGVVMTVDPDVIKLDRTLVANIDRDPRRYRILRDEVAIWRRQRIQVIAEGIETVGELEALMEMGVEYGQGFLLGRPAREPLSRVDWPSTPIPPRRAETMGRATVPT